ncbi:glycosyltransferase [Microbacterium neimengense]
MADSPLIPEIHGARAILVASTGGHLAQLHRLAPQLGLAADPLWVTFESEQSKSLLKGQRVVYLPYIAPRDFRAVARSGRIARRLLREEEFDVAISTGAAAALPILPRALVRRKKVVYIESVSRFEGPSLTGRLMSALPGVRLFTQHPQWASSRWKHAFSVLDDFGAAAAERTSSEPLRVFVTLGTIKPYRFDQLVDQMKRVAPDAEFHWQLGETTRDDLPGDVRTYMSADDFEAEAAAADVVVTHAGVGTALKLLDMGIFPVLVPRRAHRGEHVDDHQLQIARNLEERGLALAPAADQLSQQDLLVAASRRVERAVST